jgi:hypothetical protein
MDRLFRHPPERKQKVMATTARLGIDITATDRTRAAFASSQRSIQNIDRSVRQLKGAFAGLTGGNILAGLVRSLIEVNKHTEPVKSAITTLHRAWQAFALQVGGSGLNAALVEFVDTMSKMLVGSSRLSDVLGRTLAGVVNGLRRTFEVLGRTIGFVYDNFDLFKKILLSLAAVAVAQRIFTIAQTFLKLTLAVRAAALVMGVYHLIQHRTIIAMAGMAAIGAKVTGTFEELKKFMGDVWKTAEELVPVLGGEVLKALNSLGFSTEAFTEDFDKFGAKLKSLPKTFEELAAAGKASKPFENALTDLDQYLQGLRDQAAAIGMSEAALARLNASQDIYNKLQDKGIKLNEAQRAQIEQRLNQIPALLEKASAQQSKFQLLQDTGQMVADGFMGFFDSIIDGSKSAAEALKDMVSQMLASLTKLLLNRAFEILLNGEGGGGGILGAIWGGGKAAGGAVTRGQGYMVGEHGPEMFVPGSSGAIIPSRGGEGKVSVIVQNPPGLRTEQRQRKAGGQTIIELIQTVVRGELASDSSREMFDKGYGLSPSAVRR